MSTRHPTKPIPFTPFTCLRCGHHIDTEEDRKSHHDLRRLGPNTCRRVYEMPRQGFTGTRPRVGHNRPRVPFPTCDRTGWHRVTETFTYEAKGRTRTAFLWSVQYAPERTHA